MASRHGEGRVVSLLRRLQSGQPGPDGARPTSPPPPPPAPNGAGRAHKSDGGSHRWGGDTDLGRAGGRRWLCGHGLPVPDQQEEPLDLHRLHRHHPYGHQSRNGAKAHAKRRFPDSLGVGDLALDPRSRSRSAPVSVNALIRSSPGISSGKLANLANSVSEKIDATALLSLPIGAEGFRVLV